MAYLDLPTLQMVCRFIMFHLYYKAAQFGRLLQLLEDHDSYRSNVCVFPSL